MLQSMLEDLMTWHASLLQSILDRQNHPDMANARKLAALDQTVWRMHRRERKKEAQQRMVQGSRLVKERDSSKRNFEDMSDAEQQVLEDFDTGRSAQRHAKECDLLIICAEAYRACIFPISRFGKGLADATYNLGVRLHFDLGD